MKSKAFTLIELLVVIAIIAILAAILFPVFAQAREAARKTSCLSNVKQLSLGVQMYTQDYDEDFPFWNWTQNSANSSQAKLYSYSNVWWNAIYAYVKNGQIFACPNDNIKMTPSNSALGGWATQSGDAAMQSFGINQALWHQ